MCVCVIQHSQQQLNSFETLKLKNQTKLEDRVPRPFSKRPGPPSLQQVRTVGAYGAL